MIKRNQQQQSLQQTKRDTTKIIMERRVSTTSSESSVEPMDLGRTSKQLINKNEATNLSLATTNSMNNDSDNCESDNDEDEEEFSGSSSPIRRDNLRHIDNTLSLRKKFRISTPNRNNNNNNINNNNKPTTNNDTTNNTSTTTTTTSTTDRTNNESGFVDGSSHHLNSSPESGIGERDDVKYVCPICEIVSATPHEFTNHIRCHNYTSGDSENFTCRICSKVLSSASSLDRHVLVHTGERPFNCKYCHLTFTTNGNMHRHMRTHKQHQQQRNASGIGSGGGGGVGGGGGIGSSSGPGSGSSGPGSGGSGAGGGDGESYESDGCSTDSSASSSTNNNNLINNNNYKRKSTDDDSGIIKRRMKTTINNNVINENDSENHSSPTQKFCCPVCNRNDFISMLSLGTHMDREHPGIPAKCRQCEIIFKSHKALNAHRCLNKVNITQGFKDITFVDFSSEKFPLIAKSLCEQTIRTPITNQIFECPKCYRAFPCASAVDIHIKDCGESPQDFSMRNRARSESSDEDNRRDEFFAHLDLQNKSAMSLTSTMSSPHASDKSDNAKNLDLERTPQKSYHQHQLRDQEQQHQHDQAKDLADIQSILNVTSSSSSFLRNFEKCVNTPSSEYGYGKDEEEAQDAFTSEFRKMKLRGEFPCKLCIAVFPNLRALKGHNRIHLSAAGAGPYRCNMCPYSIHDKAALIRHMRTHNGDRPYECAVCNYAFTTKANCERHLRNRHAKTTREEVKRAIIYHPSEDSSCDDPNKKVHLFSSPEFDQDDENTTIPKDRSSTPVSHLKEMLQSDKPVKIQVKSLEKLIDKTASTTTPSVSTTNLYEDSEKEYDSEHNHHHHQHHHHESSSRAMDLTMDVLDLSKKSKTVLDPVIKSENEPISEQQPKIDLAMIEKNQQMLFAQQQLLQESLPKMDPTHYFQLSQLYRNFVLPTLNPFFLQNSFLPNNLNELNKMQPNMLFNPMFGGPGEQQSTTPQHPNLANGNTNTFSTKLSEVSSQKQQQQLQQQPPPSSAQLLQQKTTASSSPQLTIPRHHPHLQQPQPSPQPTLTPTTHHNTGPVKMVIKNGVLMPKQKQRRYRTERPFACEHCSARFTLRSNMERHIKQQHPQYWAQRQRTGHHVMRRGSSVNVMPQISSSTSSTTIPPPSPSLPPNHFSVISDQVKYAILAQHLKSKKDTDMQQLPPSHISSGSINTHTHNFNNNNHHSPAPTSTTNNINHCNNNMGGSFEDDDPKLVIDEEDDEEDPDIDDINHDDDDESKPEDLSKNNEPNAVAKKVAETILEQAIKASSTGTSSSSTTSGTLQQPLPLTASSENPDTKEFGLKHANNMIARAESVGKYLKEVASSSFKDESTDLVSVSKLVDNATNALSFNTYFRPSDAENQLEHSDEEGLVASGSASESNNSGTEDPQQCPDQKKKSAYSLAPNRVSCPYCQRMFPWSSSLRRHILTHTGQKPFKCSHCPLLFTTKSNCDRHLMRKHGNVESAVSLYVPIDDIPDPVPTPKPVVVIDEPNVDPTPKPNATSAAAAVVMASLNLSIPNLKTEPIIPASDLPFKCHLCDSSFAERMHCLEHIKIHHVNEFALLLAKGAIDADADCNQLQSAEDDDRNDGRGKYPDYANRKVICAFCMRRFWSTEDLRRHMRTHSGERPFMCEVCKRKFTLKHSMLRHMKKHSSGHHNNQSNVANSGSELSDDEQPTTMPTPLNLGTSLRHQKIQEILSRAGAWRANNLLNSSGDHKENIDLRPFIKTEKDGDCENSDLIGNLLGISDQGILNKLLSSPEEAAKLLGVEK